MNRTVLSLCLVLAAAIFAMACQSSGEGGRVVNITQADGGCTPETIQATPGEKLNLTVTNETGSGFEVEGIEGTNVDEVIVSEGRTREVGFDVPDEGGTFKIKCYKPGGVSTIIEVTAGDGAAGGGGEETGGEPSASADAGDADATVTVGLIEYTVTPDDGSVPAGSIRFEATNESDAMVHELAVLRVEDNGDLENMGEIEDIAIGDSGTVTIDLEPGNYQLACLLVPGEADSTTDHYQEGMFTEFTVTE